MQKDTFLLEHYLLNNMDSKGTGIYSYLDISISIEMFTGPGHHGLPSACMSPHPASSHLLPCLPGPTSSYLLPQMKETVSCLHRVFYYSISLFHGSHCSAWYLFSQCGDFLIPCLSISCLLIVLLSSQSSEKTYTVQIDEEYHPHFLLLFLIF